jgi:hypothetical protein
MPAFIIGYNRPIGSPTLVHSAFLSFSSPERRKSLLAFAHDLSSGRFHITPTDEMVVELLLNGGVDTKRPRHLWQRATGGVCWVGHCDRSLFDEAVGICIRQARSKELCFADLVSIPIL